MYMVCGNSLEDLLNGVKKLIKAQESGMLYGVGASSMEELLKALDMIVGD